MAVKIVIMVCLLLWFPVEEGLCRYRVDINVPARQLQLYGGTTLYKEFPVAIGSPQTPTPLGSFRLIHKVEDPYWYPEGEGRIVEAGPDNPLGSRWLGLDLPGYGIHGTNEQSSIGEAVTGGCIRMTNEDVLLLCAHVPLETPVHIEYRIYDLELDSMGLHLVVYEDLYHRHTQPREDIRRALSEKGLKPHGAALDRAWHYPHKRTYVPLWVPLTHVEHGIVGWAFFYYGEYWLPHGFMEGVISLDDELQEWYRDKGQKIPSMLPLPAIKEKALSLAFTEDGHRGVRIEKSSPGAASILYDIQGYNPLQNLLQKF